MRQVLVAGVIALLALAGRAQAADGTMVLYTSQPDAIAAQTVAAFRKAEPGVTVEVFRSGTTQVLSKLAAEIAAGSPHADALLIADAMSLEGLKAAGQLAPEPDIDVSALPAASYDAGRTYFGTKLITTGIAVNTHATFVPKTWADLLRPEVAGSVALPSPLYSGAAMITAGAFAQDAALGPNFLAKLAKAGATATPGNGGVLSAVSSGQDSYGILVDFMALNAAKKGAPIRFVIPAEGLTAVTEPVAVLKSAHNPAAAAAFVRFLLSRPGQELAAQQGFLPARQDVPPPPGFPAGAEVKLMPVDLARVLQDQAQLKQSFATAFGE